MRIPELTTDQVGPEWYLLDVREDEEWAAGHAPGAVHLPMTQLPGRLAEVPADRDVLVVCRSGHRSAQVVGYLLGNGYTRVANLVDGMIGWAAAGRPVVSGDGSASSAG